MAPPLSLECQDPSGSQGILQPAEPARFTLGPGCSWDM